MKIAHVALLSAAGMLLSTATVLSFAGGSKPPSAVAEVASPGAPIPPGTDADLASFNAGSTLRVEGRVGHPRMVKGSRGETFVLLEVQGDSGARAAKPAPSHLAIVIDRSGSMKGDRIKNALDGAASAVDHLGDGDQVSVVAFDDRATVVVPATEIDAGSRERVKAEIRKIGLGGETCISCGIEDALSELQRSADKVDRMIVLSDGEATAGVRDLPGFQAIAARARSRGVGITTMGLGVTYNQKVLGAIALDSGGSHHFIENLASLERVFQAEADKLRATVAAEAEASIDLGAGVELERVFDRTFERRGRSVVVPLGTFAQGDTKTVLLQVRVPSRDEGAAPVADVRLTYRDLVDGRQSRCEGTLGVVITRDPNGGSPLDAVVSGRVQRSLTAAALLEANDLFARGRVEEAERRLAVQQKAVAAAATAAAAAGPPAKRKADVENDFAGQAGSLDGASRGLNRASPKPAAAVRRNQEKANQSML